MRILHTMLRVGNLERSLHFYTQVLGMKLLRKQDFPEGRFTLSFVGYADESEQSVVLLTHKWETERYELGTGYVHNANGVEDVYRTCDIIRPAGGAIDSEPDPSQADTTGLALVK